MKTITIQITDLEEKILNDDLLDIENWVKDAVIGKINSCKKRLLIKAQAGILNDADIDVMPATADGLIQLWISTDNYKNAQQRQESK